MGNSTLAAMAMVNIPSTNNDPQYRYKMPRLVTKIEGRGNGIKTCVVNMGDVARVLKRPPQYTTKWFGNELGAQSTYTNKEGEGERAIVNGAHDTSVFQELLDKFISKYVCCENCHLPEIDMAIKKGVIKGNCAACGWQGDLDNNHKLAAFITKNPPDASGINIMDPGDAGAKGGGKPSKQERREAKLRKQAEKGNEDGDEDDDDEEEKEVKEKKEKKEKKDKKDEKDKKDKKEKKSKSKDEDGEEASDDDEVKEKKAKKEKKDKKDKKDKKEKKDKKDKKEKKARRELKAKKAEEKAAKGEDGEDEDDDEDD